MSYYLSLKKQELEIENGKCLTIGSGNTTRKEKQTLLVVFANFCVVNTLLVANFRLPTSCLNAELLIGLSSGPPLGMPLHKENCLSNHIYNCRIGTLI